MALTMDPDACTMQASLLNEANVYRVDATGASVNADSSISLIRQYCEKLPGDSYYTPKPRFKFTCSEGSISCELILPASAAFQNIMGPPSKDSHLAKQLACLEACKRLHKMGYLDDHLQPCIEDYLKRSLNAIELDPDAGMTKRKELHGTTVVRTLSGSWGAKEDGAVFQAYQLNFACNLVEEIYSDFVLLIESKLEDDVGNVEMDLYLIGKQVKATVSSCGPVNLDHQQMAKARCFQEFLFNGLFGSLFIGSKENGRKREFLLQADTKLPWKPSYMYLLLPVEGPKSPDCDAWNINWAGIDSCVSVVDFLKENSLLNLERSGSRPCKPCNEECEGTEALHFANGTFDATKDMVIITIHTGRIYSIVEAVEDMSAESPFEGGADVVQTEYSSYVDYFSKKYGIVLALPKQPMLRLKQSHNPHNLLVNFNNEDTSKKAEKAGLVSKKPRAHVHLPPELLVKIDIQRSILKSLYLLPSVMHRLESLMIASQLREEINCCINNFHIPSSLILEGLTTTICCEAFSMERLELLGDSVLKYAVSCHLYLKNPDKNEGHLSSQRQAMVCNSMLHKLGTDRELQNYIRDSTFDPRRWVAPGQRTLHPVPCKCGIDTLEVPLGPKFHTQDTKVKVGKFCDMGHRWMVSKTISDCVEALIGAYYVSGGLAAALHTLKWLGLDVDLNPSLVEDAIKAASLKSYVPKNMELDNLEAKLGHKFSVRFLLQEAITHQSQCEFYSYQRLEFLGDAVLDLLITQHLYKSYLDIDPGVLTDLRAASVNNQNFARVAVRKNLYMHLQYSLVALENDIIKYVKSFPDSDDTVQAPKALGDLVESIAGAVLIDAELNLDELWRIFEPLLSPLVTPEKLELPPLRALIEFCNANGYFFSEECISRGETFYAKLRLQLRDDLLVGEGSERTRKLARGKAAACLLRKLENINVSKRKNPDLNSFNDSSTIDAGERASQQSAADLPGFETSKMPKRVERQVPVETKVSLSQGWSKTASTFSKSVPVLPPISMKKGGPRITLFELCKRQLWPVPIFNTMEHKSRTPIEFDDGLEKRTGFSSFVSTVTLHIPGDGSVVCTGDPRADKKTSYDSAVLTLLRELNQQGKIAMAESQ